MNGQPAQRAGVRIGLTDTDKTKLLRVRRLTSPAALYAAVESIFLDHATVAVRYERLYLDLRERIARVAESGIPNQVADDLWALLVVPDTESKETPA